MNETKEYIINSNTEHPVVAWFRKRNAPTMDCFEYRMFLGEQKEGVQYEKEIKD